MKIKNLLLIAALIVTAAMTSCKDDEETTPDYFAESEGSYSYTATATSNQDANLTETITGNLTVTFNKSNSTLEIKVDNDFTINGEKAEMASNGYTFDIEDDTDTDEDGDEYKIEGYDVVNLGSTGYHGLYDTGRKQIEIGWTEVFTAAEFGGSGIIVELLATKQ